MILSVPDPSLVVLMGASGSGKSSFAGQHFGPSEVLSSDFFRWVVANDETDQSATEAAFELLHLALHKRLERGLLTVVDATNVQKSARAALVRIAKEHDLFAVAIALDLPEEVCQARNEGRANRAFGPQVVRRHVRDLRASLRGLEREGFREVHVLRSSAEVDAARVERRPLRTDRRLERGPFDIIGDIHGCLEETLELLGRLGYARQADGSVIPPEGRRAIFLGDLVDRGPDPVGALRLVMGMVASGAALCVPGNHDVKLARALSGRKVTRNHGLAETMAALEAQSGEFQGEVRRFIESLTSHYVLDGGALVVAHAGLPARFQGRSSGRVREFALYGDVTGETDAYGLPVRRDWAADYRGQAAVVYGHTPVHEPRWVNGAIDIDTGCAFGGRLTALRWPERELVSVPARATYAVPARPLLAAGPGGPYGSAPLDLADFSGRVRLETRLGPTVILTEAQSAAALEVLGRFAVDPRWLVYLPPTMSPPETRREGNLLEHPLEAFAHYRAQGIERVVLEEKHMGSRCVAVVCRDEAAVRRRFGEVSGLGMLYTRSGRRFFDNDALEEAALEALRAGMERSGLWEELNTDWVVLDAELLPWTAKAQQLVRQQYAAVSAAASADLAAAETALAAASARGVDLEDLLEGTRRRTGRVRAYREAFLRYCGPAGTLGDLRLAPFHLLASEGAVHADKPHAWHLEQLERLSRAAPEFVQSTRARWVDLSDEASVARGVAWWEDLTRAGGEGVVVKPESFVARGPKGLVQPGIKVRGREYLRIIYGPEYTAPEHLERLRSRAVGAKRARALREFALGLEGLQHFVEGSALWQVHRYALGVMGLEADPMDPRL
ncbi:protein phosphatase [Deinobacterium chartae]|uniref:Protein phosphatase n=1 Tax=Deinobacterium chartae TaxID=521158 RepID=A0A841I1H4_9DEIO|nr:polynucleotide kinase-phosphatase [Deinobacterium chartae]MBB6098834.1 protein phosphatase [Deinobacterium chartae]